MARTNVGNVEGLIKILSAENLPLYPKIRGKQWEVEIERYINELHQYLRRQNGKFTAQNLVNTISGSDGLGFDKVLHASYHYKGTDNPTIIVDTSYDWRKSLGFFFRVSASATSAAAVLSAPDQVYCGINTFSGGFAGYPFSATAYSDTSATQSIDIQADGSLETKFNGTGGHREFWVDIVMAGMVGIETDSSKFVSKGNGL